MPTRDVLWIKPEGLFIILLLRVFTIHPMVGMVWLTCTMATMMTCLVNDCHYEAH